MTDLSVGYRVLDTEAATVLPASKALRNALLGDDLMRDHLRALCASALCIDGADHAGIALLRQGRSETVARTDAVPAVVDRIRAATGQGPLPADFAGDGFLAVPDVIGETRWPAFAGQVLRQSDVRSLLGIVLFAQDGDHGMLTLYADRPDAFPFDRPDYAALNALVAGQFAVGVQAVHEHHRAAKLEEGLDSNRRIGTAVGILMSRHTITEQEAFQRLRNASQNLNRKLREIADDVIFTGELDVVETPRLPTARASMAAVRREPRQSVSPVSR